MGSHKPINVSDAGAIILAGGLGTRIRDLYPSIPKPMIEVCGRPFIEWVIGYLSRQGLKEICLSIGYKADVIEKYFKQRQYNELKIYFMKEESPQGTAGGFLLSASKFNNKDYLLAANGDSLILADLFPPFETVKKEHYDAVIIGRRVEDCARYGSLECDENGTVIQFREKDMGEGLINAGIYIFPRNSLKYFPLKRPLSFEYDVFPSFLQRGMRIKVFIVDDPFIDIGTPEGLRQAEAFIKKHRAKFIQEE